MACFVGEAFQLLWLAFGTGDTGLVASWEREQGRMGESQKSVGFESHLLSVQSNYDKFHNLGYFLLNAAILKIHSK